MINEELVFGNPMLFAILFAWSLAWKGVALWKSARRESKPWFVAILLINTLGILDIIYVMLFSKKQDEKENEQFEEVDTEDTK